MREPSYDWSEFFVHSYIDRPVNDVFAMWATSGGLELFFIASARLVSPDGTVRKPNERARAGDDYQWKWIHDHELSGKVTEIDDSRSIAFTFGSMEVSVEVRQVGDSSLVKLRQYNIPCQSESDKAENHLNCRSCWVFFLTNLKSVLETGRDLRETDPARSDCVSIHFEPKE